MSKGVAALIGLAVIALPLVVYSVVMLLRLRASRDWRTVPGVVVRSWLEETIVPGSERVPAWYVRVIYDYDGAGARRTGTVVNQDPQAYRFPSRRKALRYLARWPAGAPVKVYLAPDGRPALTTRVDWERLSHYLATGLGGLVALACGAALYRVLP